MESGSLVHNFSRKEIQISLDSLFAKCQTLHNSDTEEEAIVKQSDIVEEARSLLAQVELLDKSLDEADDSPPHYTPSDASLSEDREWVKDTHTKVHNLLASLGGGHQDDSAEGELSSPELGTPDQTSTPRIHPENESSESTSQEALIAELQGELSQLRSEKQLVAAQNREFQHTVKQLTTQNKQLLAQLVALEGNAHGSPSHRGGQAGAHYTDALAQRTEALAQELADANADKAELASYIEQLEEQVAVYQQEVARLEVNFAGDGEIMPAPARLAPVSSNDALQTENASLRRQLSDMDAHLAHLSEGEIRELHSEVASLHSQLEQLAAEKRQVEAQLAVYKSNTDETTLERAIKLAVEAKEAQAAHLKEQLHSAQYEHDQEMQELHDALLQAQNNCLKLERGLKESEAKRDKMKMEAMLMEQQLQETAGELAERERQLGYSMRNSTNGLPVPAEEECERLREENVRLMEDLVKYKTDYAQLSNELDITRHEMNEARRQGKKGTFASLWG